MNWINVFEQIGCSVASREQLLAFGASSRMLTVAVRGAHLLRVRRDHYALPSLHKLSTRAVRVGGKLGCASALRDHDIFGFDSVKAHIHLERDGSRLRSPGDPRRSLTPRNRGGDLLHWSTLLRPEEANEYRIGIVDALAETLRCNHRWHALASIENALFLKRITELDLGDVFSRLPESRQHLRKQLDGRSEAGQETVLRSALWEAGIESEIQVEVPGVGRVDGLIEGRLIWECDSRLAHEGWDMHVRDRNRDIDAARQGYMSIRPAYNRTMFATGEVVEAVKNLLAATRHFRFLI